jgi:hypothetical protein
MGGGSTIPNVIKNEKKRFKNNKGRFPKESHVYLRYFVLIDSDKTHPKAPLKEDKNILIKLFEENNIEYHILEKREMENYIPEFILSSFNDNYLNLYIKLSSSEQKDFFDLEKGFNKNRSDRNYDSNILKLYESVSNDDWNMLKNGIKISPYDKQFKSEFPKLFMDSSVDLNSLQARCGTNELKEILDKIAALL